MISTEQLAEMIADYRKINPDGGCIASVIDEYEFGNPEIECCMKKCGEKHDFRAIRILDIMHRMKRNDRLSAIAKSEGE